MTEFIVIHSLFIVSQIFGLFLSTGGALRSVSCGGLATLASHRA